MAASVDERPLSALRPHPENATIFGDPEESDQFEGILASIKSHGIWEPLVVKADGTILAGHLRFLVAQKLKLKTVPVRVEWAELFARRLRRLGFAVVAVKKGKKRG